MPHDYSNAFQRWDGTKRKKLKAIFYVVAGCMISFLCYVDPLSAGIFTGGAYLYLR